MFSHAVGPDVEEYDLLAKQILTSGNIFPAGDVSIHAPLYPLFLALLYKISDTNYFFVRAVQLLMNLCAGVLLFLILFRLSSAKKHIIIAYIFLVIWMIYTPLIFYQAELISESLLLPLLAVVIFFLYKAEEYYFYGGGLPQTGCLRSSGHQETKIKSRNPKYIVFYFLAGIFGGLSIITHPYSMLFILAELLWIIAFPLFWGRKVISNPHSRYAVSCTHGTLFFIGLIIPLMPISLRNSLTAGRFILVQKNSGFNFFLGNNPQATGGCYIRPGHDWDKLHAMPVTEQKKSISENINEDAFFINKALKFIYNSPVQWCGLLLRKALYTINETELTAGADSEFIRYYTAIMRYTRYFPFFICTLAIFGLVYMFLPFFGLTRLIRCSTPYKTLPFEYRHFLFLFFSFWAGLTIFVTSGRYRTSMFIGFILLASYAIRYFYVLFRILIAKYRKKYTKRIYVAVTYPLITLSFCAALVMLPVPVNTKQDAFEALSLYGESYMNAGNYNLAKIYLLMALRLKNSKNKTPRAYFNVFEEIHNKTSSISNPETGLPVLKNCSREYNLLGLIYKREKKLKAAEKMFILALLSDKNYPFAYMNLAILYSETRKIKQAGKLFREALKKAQKKTDISEVLYNYGFFCHKLHKYKKALTLYLRAIKLNPANGQALNAAGVIYIIKRDFKNAVKYLKKALILDPENKGIKSNIAIAYRMSLSSGIRP